MKIKMTLFLLLILFIHSSQPAKAENTKSFLVHFPQRLVSFTVGTAIGTPIAVIRCTGRELVRQPQEALKLGGVPKPLGYLSAAFFGIPSGLLCGAGYGVSDGFADSWLAAKDAPFSKASFSLDKLAY